MFSTIPESWRGDFRPNVTLTELQDALVTLHLPTIIFLAVLMVIGVVGNVFVLVIYFRYRPTFFRVFILWLGVIDLVACGVGVPLLIISMTYPYDFPSVVVCKTFRFIHVFLVVSSVFIFMFISVERHRSICGNLRIETKDKRVHKMCFAASFLGIVFAVPAIFIYGDATVSTGFPSHNGTECFIEDKFKDSLFPKTYFIVQLLACLVSVTVIAVLYIRIGRRLVHHRQFSRRHSRKPSIPTATSVTNSRRGSQAGGTGQLSIEITKMLFVVTVVFVLSFIPHLILIVLTSVNDQFAHDMSPVEVVLYNLFLRSFVINNMANPVVYIFWPTSFRKDVKKLVWNIITCCRGRQDDDHSPTQSTEISSITELPAITINAESNGTSTSVNGTSTSIQ